MGSIGKFSRYAFMLVFTLFCAPLLSTVPQGYQLTWNDEFDGNVLDTTEWLYRADEKHRSIQLPSNVEVTGGNLVLNLTPLDVPINGFDYAGAGIVTRDRFRYGYYETRSRLGDGIDHDNDGMVDEGWHHSFWAMLAEETPGGTVSTTFPDIRRTEIDGYENDSTNLNRMTQHVLPWNEQGNIIRRLPADDVSELAPGTQHDWHTYGFEWTPKEVHFYIDGELQKVADYDYREWEHTDVNLWLTAISANWSDPQAELSEAHYDYFRFYEKGAINIIDGETMTAGVMEDLPVTSDLPTGGISGDITVQSGGQLNGAGWVYGNVTVQSGGIIRVGAAAAEASHAVTSTEDFESYTPGTAFANGIPTGLTPSWTFYDLADPGESTTDTNWEISGADGTANQPLEASLVGESQMLFQTNTNPDFSIDPQGSPFAGAIAVTDSLDTSDNADIIDVDFVFDGYGDPSNQYLDSKLVFGFRDVDNWFALSLVRGSASSTGATEIQLSVNVDGDRQTVFSTGGTDDFAGYFEQDTILHAQIQHDAALGFVSFEIVDPITGIVLAEASGIDDRLKFDGDVGLAMNNDATGIDNLSVLTQAALPLEQLQDLEILGDVVFDMGAMLELDMSSTTVYDLLLSTGTVDLGGSLEMNLAGPSGLAVGDIITIVNAEGGVTGEFDNIYFTGLPEELSFVVNYQSNSVEVEIVAGLGGDFNGDGVVDAADFTVWRDNLGATDESAIGFNGDGISGIDMDDYLLWATNYGNSTSVAVALTVVNVPEPASVMMLCFLSGFILKRRA